MRFGKISLKKNHEWVKMYLVMYSKIFAFLLIFDIIQNGEKRRSDLRFKNLRFVAKR